MRGRLNIAYLLAVLCFAYACAEADPPTMAEPFGINCADLADGAACDDFDDELDQVCLVGTCVLSECGDGFVGPAEDCEPEGSQDESCNGDCTFVCVDDADCDDGNECTMGELCAVDHSCVPGNDLTRSACTLVEGGAGACNVGRCVAPGCGNGLLDEEEECDDGNVEDQDGCDSDCTYSCTEDTECDDENPCTGVETCDLELHVCVLGEPTECLAPDACTVSACNPETGLCEDSVDPDVDADADGYADVSVPGCGDDCADDDPDVNPGHIEICGDGKDNNCSDGTNDEAVQTWWADCDGDGFAANGALSKSACDKPDPSTAGCPPGMGDWTAVNPNSTLTRDCADQEVDAYPGATAWHPNAIPGTSSYDWNCNNSTERQWPKNTIDCFGGISRGTILTKGLVLPPPVLQPLCLFGGGWRDGSAPFCGTSEYWEFCGDDTTCGADEWRQQKCR